MMWAWAEASRSWRCSFHGHAVLPYITSANTHTQLTQHRQADGQLVPEDDDLTRVMYGMARFHSRDNQATRCTKKTKSPVRAQSCSARKRKGLSVDDVRRDDEDDVPPLLHSNLLLLSRDQGSCERPTLVYLVVWYPSPSHLYIVSLILYFYPGKRVYV